MQICHSNAMDGIEAFPLGGISSNFTEIFGIRKLEALGYCVGSLCGLIIGNFREHKLVIDRET